MEGLRWWLLLLTALMFSMSGCASHKSVWATNPAHDMVPLVGAPAPTVLVLDREPQ